ncbi:putative cytosine-purine permease [Lyophyllum shimeji]|uniref:Cytosine-purine permease n=1 Tax=Lyophyllum shimeji TaxID=47721 RepID=A0A9P3UPG9_LYOSH|nr:putative cytosine-purine permease [Lyophyllum shimeji]
MRYPNFLRPSAWSLELEKATFGPSAGWSNQDMDPVPVPQRTWTTWNFIAYWISDATHVAMWQFASSMLAIGLTWRQALVAIAVGHMIIAIVMVLNGTVGARLHVAFPVLNRSSFGFWFSYFSVISRVILAMFWFSIQTFSGSECVYQMLKAIWPSVARIPNGLPPSSPITTVQMMSYFLYWLLQFPLLLVSPQKIRHFFTVKSIVVPCTWLAILIWAMVRVPASVSLAPHEGALSGSGLAWAWLSALNSSLGLYATVSINIPDFTRYAKNERAQFVQLLIIPVAFTLTGFIGIAVTSAAEVIYGEVLWDPLRLIDRWDNRAAAFFASFSFMLSTIGVNISANSLSAANDMMVLCPRYINIRRGQVICALLGGWALCPWEILATAPGFLSFMSGYTVFLGPFAGIMIADYWLVHRGKVDVPAMYHPRGRYRYWNGINWRAAVTLLCSVTPTMPGLIANINSKIKVGNASRLFDIAWLYGFFSALTIYWVLSTLFPARETYMSEAIRADDVLNAEISGPSSLDSSSDEKSPSKHESPRPSEILRSRAQWTVCPVRSCRLLATLDRFVSTVSYNPLPIAIPRQAMHGPLLKDFFSPQYFGGNRLTWTRLPAWHPSLACSQLGLGMTQSNSNPFKFQYHPDDRHVVQFSACWDAANPAITRLPPEIMSYAFTFALTEDPLAPPSVSGCPLLLGRICRHWRNIFLSTPELWYSFHLDLEYSYEFNLEEMYKKFSPHDLGIMVRLIVALDAWRNAIELLESAFASPLPRLRKLKMGGFPPSLLTFIPSPIFSQLTSLHSNAAESVQDCREILSLAHYLRQCRLDLHRADHVEATEKPTRVTHRSLQKLYVGHTDLSFFFDPVTLPALQALSIDGAPKHPHGSRRRVGLHTTHIRVSVKWETPRFLAFLSRSMCTLTKLSFFNLSLFPSCLIACLEAVSPTLLELHVEGGHWTRFINQAVMNVLAYRAPDTPPGTLGSRFYCPQLERIRIRIRGNIFLFGGSGRFMVDMSESRFRGRGLRRWKARDWSCLSLRRETSTSRITWATRRSLNSRGSLVKHKFD